MLGSGTDRNLMIPRRTPLRALDKRGRIVPRVVWMEITAFLSIGKGLHSKPPLTHTKVQVSQTLRRTGIRILPTENRIKGKETNNLLQMQTHVHNSSVCAGSQISPHNNTGRANGRKYIKQKSWMNTSDQVYCQKFHSYSSSETASIRSQRS